MLHSHAYKKYCIPEKFHLRSFCAIAQMQWPQAFFEQNILVHYKFIHKHSNAFLLITIHFEGKASARMCTYAYEMHENADRMRANAS